MSALHQQMAYQYDLMPLEVAEKIAIRFCGLFSTSYQAFSQKPQSEDIAAGVVGTFGYVLPNTFSDGVVLVDDARVGLLWIGDED